MIIIMNIECSINSNDDKEDKDKNVLASVLAEATIARGKINDIDRKSAIFSALYKIDEIDDNDEDIINQETTNEFNSTNSNSNTISNTNTNTNNILARRELPDNATVWELFKEQIRSDFAPLIMILPKPFKAFIVDQYNTMKDPLRKIILGASEPMLNSLHFIFKNVGNMMIIIGEECSKLASSIAVEKDGRNTLISIKDNTKVDDQDIYIHTKDTYEMSENNYDDDDVGEVVEI